MFNVPTEVTLAILSRCPFADLKNVSLVSTQLRQLAALLLFHSITIRLSIWEVEEERRSDFKAVKEKKEREVAMRALDLLVGVVGNPVLANAVRSLTVFAFTKSFLVFELHHIERFLQKAVNLEQFRWIGGKPAFPRQLSTALIEFNPSIQSLNVLGLDEETATNLSHLNCLQSLELVDPNEPTGEWDPHVGLEVPTLQTLLNTHSRSLRRLSIQGHNASEVNILRCGDALTHLFISLAGACNGLDLFLQHAEVLYSLVVTGCDTLSFLPTGRGAKDALPALRELKLILSLPTTSRSQSAYIPQKPRNFLADSRNMLEFSAIHTSLLRFDFSIETRKYFELESAITNQEDNDRWFPNVIKAVCNIEAATALGISFPKLSTEVLEKALTDIHDNGISWQCTALRMAGAAESSYSLIVDDSLPYLTRLQFLSLSNHRPMEQHDDLVPLPTLHKLQQIWSLDLVCLNNTMYDLRDRGRLDLELAFWRLEKVGCRKPSDFPNEDAFWLMSHRLITRKHDYGPDMEEDW